MVLLLYTIYSNDAILFAFAANISFLAVCIDVGDAFGVVVVVFAVINAESDDIDVAIDVFAVVFGVIDVAFDVIDVEHVSMMHHLMYLM